MSNGKNNERLDWRDNRLHGASKAIGSAAVSTHGVTGELWTEEPQHLASSILKKITLDAVLKIDCHLKLKLPLLDSKWLLISVDFKEIGGWAVGWIKTQLLPSCAVSMHPSKSPDVKESVWLQVTDAVSFIPFCSKSSKSYVKTPEQERVTDAWNRNAYNLLLAMTPWSNYFTGGNGDNICSSHVHTPTHNCPAKWLIQSRQAIDINFFSSLWTFWNLVI